MGEQTIVGIGCPNGPDRETGEWPCDPKGYEGVGECQTCGLIAPWPVIDYTADADTIRRRLTAAFAPAQPAAAEEREQ